MLLDVISKRYSARIWDNTDVELSKINYILYCAYNAPSKQSVYPYEILVLGNNTKSKKIKNWLYWHDTWCVDGERAAYEKRKSPEKRFNGQYRAPILLLWKFKPISESHKDLKHYRSYPRECNVGHEVDMTVSASFAMLAAEEQGLATCFGRCHSVEMKHELITGTIPVALGIGYATPTTKTDTIIEPVYKKEKLQGYDGRNTLQSFPIERHNLRIKKPSFDEVIKFI